MSEAGVNYGERGFPALGSRLTRNSKPTKSKNQVVVFIFERGRENRPVNIKLMTEVRAFASANARTEVINFWKSRPFNCY